MNNTSANPDLDHLQAEIAELKQMLSSLQLPSQGHDPVVTLLVPAAPLPPPAVHQIPSAGITLGLETLHANTNRHALSLRKTPRPITTRNKCHWQSLKSSVLNHRSHL